MKSLPSLVAALLACPLLQGCDNAPTITLTPRTQATPAPAKDDPVAELKRHLAKQGTAGTGSALVWSNPSYDVRKTESLVSPFMGSVVVNAAVKNNPDATLDYAVILAYSDGAWRITKLQVAALGLTAKTYTATEDENNYYELFRKQYGF